MNITWTDVTSKSTVYGEKTFYCYRDLNRYGMNIPNFISSNNCQVHISNFVFLVKAGIFLVLCKFEFGNWIYTLILEFYMIESRVEGILPIEKG